jgi:nitrite reductase/ring-hydroxylating ferredoxin subunit
MGERKPVGPGTMLADGEMRELQVGDTPILVARVEGYYYATQSRCPHLQTRLARGSLEGFVVICPAHRSQFDVRDGHNLAWIPKLPPLARKMAQALKKPQDLRTYRTRTQEGQAWVDIA